MTDRPILFSAPMVMAAWEGRKKVTRRILPNQPRGPLKEGDRYHGVPGMYQVGDIIWPLSAGVTRVRNWPEPPEAWVEKNVRLKVRDRLWVREAWRVSGRWDRTKPRDLPPRSMTVFFEAGGSIANQGFKGDWRPVENPAVGFPDWAGKPRPSMFMPRWASRLTLTVTDVRVERLQDISEEDAIAEGIEEVWGIVGASGAGGVHREISGYRYFTGIEDVDCEGFETGVEAYAALWKHLNGPNSWAANPWIAAYSFDVHNCNIDAMKVAA